MDSLERNLRQQGILTGSERDRPKGVAAGTVLNDFELPVLSGGTMTLSQWSGRRVLLIFFNPACEFCRNMLPGLAQLPWPADSKDPVPILVSTGHADENRSVMERYGVQQPVLIQESREIADLYHVLNTPAGYIVDERGRTESGLLTGANDLLAAARGEQQPEAVMPEARVDERSGRAFSRNVEGSRLVRDGLQQGVSAPPFSLPQIDAAEISLQDYRGKSFLLVFSDPLCKPCWELAPKLEQFHRKSKNVSVLMISRGDVDVNRAKIAELGLTFPVVLQRHWEVSRAYGMFATPIAYVTDEAGVLASNVLVGADAILNGVSTYRPRNAPLPKELALH
ncbi:MAG: peroxiredoxin family protein [Bryobacteraceae bacterium]